MYFEFSDGFGWRPEPEWNVICIGYEVTLDDGTTGTGWVAHRQDALGRDVWRRPTPRELSIYADYDEVT